MSDASNLVAGDTNGMRDVFVRDRQRGVTERVNVASDGAQADGTDGEFPLGGLAISADGRVVAFTSSASNLVAGDSNGVPDVFVRDRLNGSTERVSVSSAGAQADGPSDRTPALSADGRVVVFTSTASNLVADDTNRASDIFLHDREAGSTERLVKNAHAPALSPDGRFVAFSSKATNGLADDTNGVADVFVRDRARRVTERVSVASDGTQADAISDTPGISADGRFVAFRSLATDLVAPGDQREGSLGGLFLRDRQARTTQWLGAPSSRSRPTVSADGRFVAFDSSERLVPLFEDAAAVVHDRQLGRTESVALTADGDQLSSARWAPTTSTPPWGPGSMGEAWGGPMTPDARFATFVAWADGVVAGDTNRTADVFVHDRALSASTPSVTMPWFPFTNDAWTGDPNDTDRSEWIEPQPFPLDSAAIRVRWSATSPTVKLCRNEWEVSVDGGPFAVVPDVEYMWSWTWALQNHAYGQRYQHRVRTTDCAGRTTPWKTSSAFVPGIADDNAHELTYTGSWSPLVDSHSLDGTLTSSSTPGDSVTYTTTARRIAWLAPRGPDRGAARVYVGRFEGLSGCHRSGRSIVMPSQQR